MSQIDYDRALPMPTESADLDTTHKGASIKRRGNSAVVNFNPGMERTSRLDSDEHSSNVVEELDRGEQTELIQKIIEQVGADLDSRQDWQRRIDQAMELMGLRNTPLADLPFTGAAAVTYPLIAEACVQFQARAIEEVFPSEGPAKTKIIGKVTVEREEQAERIKQHMNYQMTEEDKAYFWHTDQMLFYLPLSGSTFKKTYYDPISDMVVSRVVQSGDFIVPYMATDLRTSPRYTHRLKKTEGEMKRLMSSGFYREVDLVKPANAVLDGGNADSSQEMRDASDDRQQSMHEDDYIYELYETHCDLELEFDQSNTNYLNSDEKRIGKPLPYIVTVETQTEEILSVRRNWRENDMLFEKRLWFTHYKYLPGLGFYGFGLLHLIGSVAEASTGTLRALLDSAAFANMQGGFVSDEAKLDPGDYHIEPGVWKQVKMTADEMARAFYTPPFKEPSPALAKLFEILTETGRRFASITEEMTGDAPNTGPVGTTIALIEQGSKVFSGVHRRLHVAQAEEFTLRAELNFEFLDEEYPYEAEGKDLIVFKADYDGRVDVVPVSDPNIFSSVQRIAQAQAMIDLAERFPGKVKLTKAIERFLKAIKVPDYEELIIDDEASQIRWDPITENMRFLTGSGAKAFPEQDHEAHIQVHMSFLGGINQDAIQLVGPVMQSHIAEHFAFKYYNQMNEQLGGMLPPPDFMAKDEEAELPPEVEGVIAQAAAQVPPIQIMPPDEEQGPDEDQAEFEAEEQRKQQAFDADEQRKNEAFNSEQFRKDEEVDRSADRDAGKTLADESRREESHKQDLRRKEEDGKRERRMKKDRGS